ncbi:MAG TPA: ATP-binding protein [bacterium]|nr:ATP-binding protein [bacterium]
MFDFVLARGFRGIVFGLESVLLAPTLSEGAVADLARSLLFHRTVMDPRNEPLSPLLRNKPGIKHKAASLLSPFFAEGATPHVSSLYAGYVGSERLACEIQRMNDAGLFVAVWDNCPVGTTKRVHELIDGYYPGLFPRTSRFLSTRLSLELGETEFFTALWAGLKCSPDDLLIVTANPGQRDHALRTGMAAYLLAPDDPPLASALAVYLGDRGPVRDPIAYLAALNRSLDVTPLPPYASEVLKSNASQPKVGSMEYDFRCLVLAARIADQSPPVLFKPAEDVVRDAHRLVDAALRQIERGIPPLARSAMLGLMTELKGVLSIKDEPLRQSGVVQDLLEKTTAHVRENRTLYVETAKVFHDDEWSVLTEVFREDDAILDARYAAWVDRTVGLMREMSAQGARLKNIRRMVRERLLDDLILRLMEIEMTHRSLKRGVEHRDLFPLHHDARNRAALFTANIDDKQAWKRAMARHTTLAGWVKGLAMQLSRSVREAGGQLFFTHEMDAGFPQVHLSDLEDTERQSIDHILTELIRNAVKYRRPGEPLRVSMHLSENEEGLRISVADNGVGIQDVNAVLQGAVREHPELAEGYGGGLVSVRRHVESHEWSLQVDSVVGEGSRFVLSVSLRNEGARQNRLSDSGYPKL